MHLYKYDQKNQNTKKSIYTQPCWRSCVSVKFGSSRSSQYLGCFQDCALLYRDCRGCSWNLLAPIILLSVNHHDFWFINHHHHISLNLEVLQNHSSVILSQFWEHFHGQRTQRRTDSIESTKPTSECKKKTSALHN